MALTRHRVAALIALAGAACALTGIAMIYVPAALIAGGIGLLALGLAADVDGRGKRQ